MIREVVILAGGLGTRLRSVVSELPKCMAPVAGKPFLYYVINHLKKEGVQKFIFSVGYKSDSIKKYLEEEQAGINYQLSIEAEPLGTGGAIKLACSLAIERDILVVNGDTLFSINVNTLSEAHRLFDADSTLCLKPMQEFERYGVVEINKDHSVSSFKEKQFYEKGLINGGVYALNTRHFIQEALPEKFSFEKGYLEKYVAKRRIYAVIQDEYFIDIGIPSDYDKAQRELSLLWK